MVSRFQEPLAATKARRRRVCNVESERIARLGETIWSPLRSLEKIEPPTEPRMSIIGLAVFTSPIMFVRVSVAFVPGFSLSHPAVERRGFRCSLRMLDTLF